MKASDLSRLAAPFPPADIEWKPGATTRDKSKGLAMAYLTSRAVQQRFDDVCGPADWRNEFTAGPDGGVLCGISVRVEREDGTAEWVTKWDGADNSQVEAVKGGLSGATKRAAVQWGVGRYLYDLPATWVRLDDRGRFAEAPRVPREYLPSSGAGAPSGRSAPPSAEAPRERSPQRSAPRPQRSAPAQRPAPTGGEPARPSRPTPRSGQRRIVRPAPSSGDGDSRAPDPGF
ncbi:Rad52/Rad22 family DNA repair protein [Rubrivirga sp. S365]|uniref:Rad52/Rad22 family DNA repair protein n=1 Tax=Rubrivirga sp. S365 TaxID=3076080 RepID=UPI0028C7FE83|nr:Rad52/Rad22 family DNA repair protein [Rubrivirga sp. S365]MDT7855369.1 Rad52/Rad22 family DNA repair protein [Rubrivirga sp. S365]